jgi:hypothetical protein
VSRYLIAQTILKKLQEAGMSDFVFAGQKPGKPLSNMAMNMSCAG